jgi:chorismate synthase
MAGNSFGKVFQVHTWGESHGPAIGVVIDGCPAGLALTSEDIQKELNRRRPGQSSLTTTRQEKDQIEILSGIIAGETTGTPISLLIKNLDTDPNPYQDLADLFRPGHADYGYWVKYGLRDWRGGGRASARETAARVAAGAIAKKILAQEGIQVIAYTVKVGNIEAQQFDPHQIERNPIRCPDSTRAKEMINKILAVKEKGDSIGGIVEVKATGVPAGLGEPVFDKLDADLAKALMSIGSVKGIEIGAGFQVSRLLGSENNDPFLWDGGRIRTKTNQAGGILGGISTGEDIILRLAIKPTPSIAKPQQTVDIQGRPKTITIRGRHDPCICPRIIPVAEAMVALVLADHLLRHRSSQL